MKPDLSKENLDALRAGLPNLMKHIDNVTKVWGLNAVVAINRFASDTEAEIELVRTLSCAAHRRVRDFRATYGARAAQAQVSCAART